MQELANRLMAQARGTSRIAVTRNVGEALALGTLVEPARYRIGLWPLNSDENPEAAMGLMTALAFLLERWREVVVYRVFTQLEGEPDAFDWDINLSQFGVDDFEIDGLDENVAVWGTLEPTEGVWTLELEVENDFAAESEDNPILTYEAKNWNELLALLPEVAADIAALLGTEALKSAAPVYPQTTADAKAAETLLAEAFAWENELLLALWGADWPADAILEDQSTLVELGQAAGGDAGPWLVSNLVARALKTDVTQAAVLPAVHTVIEAFPDSPLPPVILGTAASEAGERAEDVALEVLRNAAAEHTEDPVVRLALAELFLKQRRLTDAIDVLQRSFQDDIVDQALYLRYGEILTALRLSGLVTPRYVFTEGDRDVMQMLDEAVAAYDKVLEQTPNQIEALYRRALLLAESDDERLWPTLEPLVELDVTGERTRAVIDSFQLVEDVGPGVDILQAAAQKHPDRYSALVNYAAALIADERGDEAHEPLERAEEMTDNLVALADIERLLLIADDPDFEFRLGTITDSLNAGRSLDDDDVEYLENALEQSQLFSLGYVLLARAYLAAKDASAALETLLDGQRYLPEDTDITALLAQTLWDADEVDLAFEYLNKGLELAPDSVPLLALIGRYLYEDEQPDVAKDFLARAESLDPNNSTLKDAKLHISRTLDD